MSDPKSGGSNLFGGVPAKSALFGGKPAGACLFGGTPSNEPSERTSSNDVPASAAPEGIPNGGTRKPRQMLDLTAAVVPVLPGDKLQDQWTLQMKDMQYGGRARDMGIEPIGSSLTASRLSPKLISNMDAFGHTELSPLQRFTVPILTLSHCDLLVRAPTGSGKTAAFVVPAIQTVVNYHKTAKKMNGICEPLVIMLSNTVNLSFQTYKVACHLAGFDATKTSSDLDCNIFAMFSEGDGNSMFKLKEHRYDIMVGTTGTLRKCIAQGLRLDKLQLFILDEADKMSDNNAFGLEVLEAYNYVGDEAKKTLRCALFSATYGSGDAGEDTAFAINETMEAMLARDGTNTTTVDVPVPKGFVTQTIIQVMQPKIPNNYFTTFTPEEQIVFRLSQEFPQRLSYILRIAEYESRKKIPVEGGKTRTSRVAIFVETKNTCNYLATYLLMKGYNYMPYNSDYTHVMSQKVMSMLAKEEIQGIVCTNKCARGENFVVDNVVIFEMSKMFNDYKHRIGRTGRIGNGGRCTVLFNPYGKVDSGHVENLFEFLKFHQQQIPMWLKTCRDVGVKSRKEQWEAYEKEQEKLNEADPDYGYRGESTDGSEAGDHM